MSTTKAADSVPDEQLLEAMDLGLRFRELRRRAGLTARAVARPRYSESYVSRIEAGLRRPSPEALAYFATRLGVSPQLLESGVPYEEEARLRYLLEAARWHLSQTRAKEAEQLLKTLLMEIERQGPAGLRAEAMASLGEALRLAGRFQEAIDAFHEALEGDLSASDRGMTLARLSWAAYAIGDLAYATDRIRTFIADREAGQLDAATLVALCSVLATVHEERNDLREAEQTIRQALAAARKQWPLSRHAHACWRAGQELAESSRWEEAHGVLSRARMLSEESDYVRGMARLHGSLASLLLRGESGGVDEAREHLDLAEGLLTQEGLSEELNRLRVERARLALKEGNPEAALANADTALTETSDDTRELGILLVLKSRALDQLGRRREAIRSLSAAAIAFKEGGARQEEVASWRELGDLHLQAGHMRAAAEAYRAALDSLGLDHYRA